MSNQIELRHLRYFKELSEELHFRKAAEKLYITQPGLSRQIQILEDEIGVRLFERNKKKVSLSRAGHYFKKEVEFILNHLNKSINHIQAVEAGHIGELNIGFVGSAMYQVIPDLLFRMNQKHPGLITNLEELSNHNQIEGLLHDELDIGFMRIDRLPNQLSLRPIKTETFSLVLPEDSPISIENFDNIKCVKDENFILFSPEYSPEYYNTILSICEDQGFTPTMTHKTVHANTIFRLVQNKMGVSIVPTSMTDGLDLQIKFIELNKIRQRTTLNIVWKNNSRNPAMKSFLDIL